MLHQMVRVHLQACHVDMDLRSSAVFDLTSRRSYSMEINHNMIFKIRIRVVFNFDSYITILGTLQLLLL